MIQECKQKLELIFPFVDIQQYKNEQQDIVWNIKCITYNGIQCETIQKFYNQWDSEQYWDYLITEITNRLIRDLIK